ncbi:MAG: HPr family phosphocarrier protein [Ruminococcaceae bacterium]|nr:HPr family phosphocarrier protein [Oscillospiraceae bacterium]
MAFGKASGCRMATTGQLVQEAQKYNSEIIIEKDGKTANLKKILMLMGLNVKCGDDISVTVSGADENTAAPMLEAFFRAHF